ncbi:uncharacterized protein LOC120412400 [Culex pipiens pallens]|uniref:uncharacterized protein LOC120412400 n=1 Tax=Culex pipiens pallens TaxID=42434 RepID=UPI0019530741|nr:uncharacterized protein LOC120412400 [Culex pipiens pallens]XP_039428791.1 uncharacterized protein LOC120412400 [Culex pipiens pallens]
MFQSSKLPARIVTVKMSIATRLRPRARAPYGQRKGLVSRIPWIEANSYDKVPFRTIWKDAKELQMPYQEAVPVRSKIRMQGPSYASFGWPRHSLSRWNHRGSTKENSASTRRFSSGLHLRRHRCFTRRR